MCFEAFFVLSSTVKNFPGSFFLTPEGGRFMTSFYRHIAQYCIISIIKKSIKKPDKLFFMVDIFSLIPRTCA